jgi:GNAT superfamily N-acetyltransferase
VEVTIKDAEAADSPVVASVMGAATAQLRSVYRPSQQAVERARAAKDVRWLLAMDGNKAVGALRYVVEPGRLHLGLGVIPEYQRKGVARSLVEFLAAKARSLGLAKLSLYTVKETGNVPIFEHLGFAIVRQEPAEGVESVSGSPLTDVYMEKLLSRLTEG